MVYVKMCSANLCSALLAFLTLILSLTVTRVEGQDPAIAALNTRVTAINTTATANKAQLSSLSGSISSLRSSVDSNYAALSNRINAVSINCSAIQAEVTQNAADLATLNGNVDTLTAALAAANEKIAKLQSINLIWQSNFRVVNKTFAELRRKVKFVSVGGLNLIPVNYGRPG